MSQETKTSNIYRIYALDSIMCGYFFVDSIMCGTGFIDFMLKGKGSLGSTNLFSPNRNEKNEY